ncbi:MAG: sigma-54-dependent Fis family transcriptional regulator [Candidatus Omnitrophota bacterium]|nr:MAG: sigma-54-dependent Fis family transcriptional regulator [Candidatus Omnitrophota bacterium]
MKNHILIADDEPLTRKSLLEILKFEGYKVSLASDGEEALKQVKEEPPDVVIADLKMPKLDGITLLRKIKEYDSNIAVVLVTAYGTIETAVEAMKEGAFDYITKPIIDKEIKIVIQRILEQKNLLEENKVLKEKLRKEGRKQFYKMIGQNPKMQKIYNLIETVAPTNATVLVVGESGTGKRLIAHALHFYNPYRKDNPFVEVSCGALPENLLESELFGHVKGSFTGAIRDRQGRFEIASGGTIFLDEIDAFSPKLQVKLLRVLQEGEFERVGDTKTIKVDVRVIAATNQDLKKLIKGGLFREDLYYRLNVIPINVPPLRERKDDIPLLVEHFLKKSSQKLKGRVVKDVSPQVMELFFAYDWPGNIRELENIIERAVILCKGEKIEIEDLPEFFMELREEKGYDEKKGTFFLKEVVKGSEKEIIERVLKECGGNRKKAAQLLGINRTTLYNKLKAYGILKKKD